MTEEEAKEKWCPMVRNIMTSQDSTWRKLAKALHNTGFKTCLFPADSDPCEKCGKSFRQLYFQGPTDAGRYYCADCVIVEYKKNIATDRKLNCAEID